MDSSQLPLIQTNLLEGSLPCVITAPHGGHLFKELAQYVEPRENRRQHPLFTTVKDACTAELAKSITHYCREWVGRVPYYVVAGFKRSYIDANRELETAACAYLDGRRASPPPDPVSRCRRLTHPPPGCACRMPSCQTTTTILRRPRCITRTTAWSTRPATEPPR